jgi:hypothetical protein
MIQLKEAIAAVLGSTIVAGIAGGIAGGVVGRIAPAFVLWLYSPGVAAPGWVSPVEFGIGLGTVCGLLMGAGTGLFLVSILTLRDAWLARSGVVKTPSAEREPAFD